LTRDLSRHEATETERRTMEPSLKGMAQYGWPHCTNYFRSAPLSWNYNVPFYKTSYPNKEA
jgi:hypothetical protein